MAQLFGLSQEQVAPIRPCFGQERGVKWGGCPQAVARQHPWDPERSALGGCPAPVPTKPSTTVAGPAQTRGSLI